MLLYCFTSARTGEVHESTARRASAREKTAKESDEDLEARVMAACYKVYKEDVPLFFFNIFTFFLPLASADYAFRDYSSAHKILDAAEAYNIDPLENNILEVIHFEDSIRDVPLFRPLSELQVTKSTGRSRGADVFRKEFASLGHRSGYTRNVTIRSCRRWALMQVDKNYSKTARMKFASYVSRDTHSKHYAHPLSEVEGLANYLGIESRNDHIQNRRGMGMHHNP
ncbi:uncharacterized protein N7498_001619 [Penicillium cinerascens]|uniref:Uncharacterized protein n=1 Tax=Penicillium cinerascens TaxID=70096 RepID=A0A9W9N8L8_9EURO|nr:uncharacterized protein N7498_001619 [Penicillium cinerascens]KAJ5215212.1 hypothetical protein N7498_001619 [Penicillium cinerascens]